MKNIEAKDAWELLAKEPASHLIDVRTVAEWTFIGYPNLKKIGKEVLMVSYMFYPQMKVNEDFAKQVSEKIPNKNDHLIFLCKTGGRSQGAANEMISAGYVNCYNLQDGFEGPLDENNHRGFKKGWKAENLAWEQN